MGKLGNKVDSSGGGVRGRGARRVALVSALALIAATMIASPSYALDGFESADGNLVNQGNTDWNDYVGNTTKIDTTVSPATTTGTGDLTWVQDRTGNPDDIFGGGVKQDKNCPATTTGSLGGGNSKFDLDRLYLTHLNDGDEDFLFVSWVRVPQNSTTASAHIAYEFNTGGTPCTEAQNGGAPLISRTSGDKLLVYDFEGGSGTSTAPSLKLLTWLTSGDTLSGSCEVSSSRPCWGDAKSLQTAGVSDGAVNTTDKANGGVVQDAIANESLGPVRFGEAGINLSHPSLDLDICDFSGKVTGVARSSGSSGTAQMKDKVGPATFELPGCVQNTTITTEVSLDDHATINGFDADFTGDHTGTLTFSLYGPDDEDCEGDPVYETTIEDIDDAGPWSTAQGDNPDGSFVVEDEGVYSWVVEYSGDSANNPSDSFCGEEVADVQYDFPS